MIAKDKNGAVFGRNRALPSRVDQSRSIIKGMSVDLATHAAANVSAHGAAADAVVGQYPNARGFRLAAAVAPMSTNVSADKMVAYASAGRWLTTSVPLASASSTSGALQSPSGASPLASARYPQRAG